MNKIMLVLIWISILLISACNKDNDLPYPLSELPPATQTGERTFGCVINGEPWVAYAPWNPWGGRLRSSYDEALYGFDYNQRLIVEGYRMIPSYDLNNDSISLSLGFTMNSITGEGYYDKQNLVKYTSSYFSVKPGPTKIYALDTLAPFYIQITKLDTIKKIVSGTFEFDMRRISDSLDVLQIRHGRFDALYQKE